MNHKVFGLAATHAALAISVAFAAAGPAAAGEITGNGKWVTINGRSLCAYSGINDTPDGLFIQVAPGVFVEIDPGGSTQNYGSFMVDDFLANPSEPGARDQFAFPGVGCNPNRSGGH